MRSRACVADGRSRSEDHRGDRDAPPHGVRATHDRDLANVGMGAQHGLDLGGRDVLATADDEVLAPVDDVETTVGVDPAQVPVASQPSVATRSAGPRQPAGARPSGPEPRSLPRPGHRAGRYAAPPPAGAGARSTCERCRIDTAHRDARGRLRHPVRREHREPRRSGARHEGLRVGPPPRRTARRPVGAAGRPRPTRRGPDRAAPARARRG